MAREVILEQRFEARVSIVLVTITESDDNPPGRPDHTEEIVLADRVTVLSRANVKKQINDMISIPF